MRIPNWVFREIENQIISILRNCTSFKELKKIHAHILVSSLSQSSYLATQIISICNANGKIDHAALVFNHVIKPNVFLYNAMIRAYTQNHHFYESINLYKQMVSCPQAKISISADRFTYPFVFKACAGLLLLNLGKQVHTHVFKSGLDSNSIIQNSLVEMYTKCDDLINAHKLFNEMGERDVVSYNTLISAHARLGQMRKARAIFNSMPNRTVVSWTALISGYNLIGRNSDAIEAFHEMQLEGFEPDVISVVSVLPACAHLGALELGKWLHAYSDKHRLLRNASVCNAFIEMYSKCGSIDQAWKIFDDMSERDVISWSSMIAGFATHGRAREAMSLFVEMESEKGVRPNSITILGVLTACAHNGLLDEGLDYFSSMKEIYEIDPGVQHYGCIVDLLGRSGFIDRAVEVIDSMPILADAAIWGSLLSACRTHGDIKTAIRAMERLVELEPGDTGNYVLLSNVYAAAGRWDGVAKMRRVMRCRRLRKTPGCSLIEVNNVVQEFAAGDDSNPWFGEISKMLDLLAFEVAKTRVLSRIESEEQTGLLDSSHELSGDFMLAEECCKC